MWEKPCQRPPTNSSCGRFRKSHQTKNIVFIDSRVASYQSLIDGLTEPAEVFILDGESDGLAQMAARLQGRCGIYAIHIISHGSQETLYLGSTVLDGGNLASYGVQLASIWGFADRYRVYSVAGLQYGKRRY